MPQAEQSCTFKIETSKVRERSFLLFVTLFLYLKYRIPGSDAIFRKVSERNCNLFNKNQYRCMLIFLSRLVAWFDHSVAEAYTTQPNSKASSRVLYNIFESTCGG